MSQPVTLSSRTRRLVFGLPLLISFVGCSKNTDTAQNPEVARQGSPQTSAPQSKDERSNQRTRRLPPSAFPQLPAGIIKQLEARGCTVAQVEDEAGPHNFIRGQFARKGQTDWAVLCSKDGQSFIFVFWGKPTACSSELALAKDAEIDYSRKIDAVSRKRILEYYKAFGGPAPPSLDHEGIEDATIGKGSIIYYCQQGNWLKLQGAD